MISIWNKIQFVRAFFGLAKNLQNIENVFKMENILLASISEDELETSAPSIFKNEGFCALLKEKYVADLPSLSKLLADTSGSFGKAYAQMLTERNFTQNFYPHVPIVDKRSFLKSRARATHDFIHVLTGYNTDLEGEIAVQAFTLGQVGISPTSLVIVCAGLLNVLFTDVTRTPVVMELFSDAYRRGKEAELLLGVRLEELLPMQLGDARLRLKIPEPRPIVGYTYIC